MISGYRQIDHTADVALEFWAPSRNALFAVAASAVVDVLTEGATIVAPTDERRATFEATDPQDGLVVWLNEVLYWAVDEGFLVTQSQVTVGDDRVTVVARGRSKAFDVLATELKSVTYHHLLLEERDGGWFGRVVIDV